ncbi:MAG: O-antigen ligase family protein [Acidimicrobiales bacterium]|nr:O-antigen ligase family protein [Acidimicrobiales bacterium]
MSTPSVGRSTPKTSPACSVALPAPDRAATRRLGRIDLAILGGALALLVVWSPSLNLGLLTPRMAITLALVGPGLVVVGGLARRGDLGARWLAGLLAWALVAALVAPHPKLSLVGSYGTDVGWIWLAGYGAAWGLGRRLAPDGVRLLPRVLLVGVLANALFAIVEAAVEPTGDLATAGGRVLGLVSNSLFLAGLLSGGLALAGRRAGGSGRRRWVALALIVPFATATNLTGSRAALAGGAVLAVVAAAVAGRAERGPTLDRTVGPLLVVVALSVGFALSLPLESATSSASRIGEVSTSSGYESRVLAWGFGLDALGERPVTGWGPGRFREATAPRTTAAFVRAEGPDKLFYDAHDLFVEHLVTTGVVGLGLLVGFVVVSFRRARGPLAWFAAGVALTWLLNPASACTAPVALLALGAAWRPRGAPARHPATPLRVGRVPVGRSIGAVVGVLGALAGATLVVADAYVDRATVDADVDAAQTAQRLLPGDATITGLVTDAWATALATGQVGPEVGPEVLRSAHRATREDPTRSIWWIRRAYVDNTFAPGSREEQLAAVEADLREALRLSPWSFEAMRAMYDLAGLRDDPAEVARWRARLCEIDACPPDAPADPDPELAGGGGG